jgi:cellulose synthase (UDP-forming)
MALVFWYTIWPTKRHVAVTKERKNLSVDVFIPVVGEPIEVIERTVNACKNMIYPNFTVYILNDGYVAKKENYQEIEKLAEEIGVNCITRKVRGGAKAGNINNALKLTDSDLIAIFDSDMVPYKEFLNKTVKYFNDESIAFVQTPQYYRNNKESYVANAAWSQQEIFFGPIMKGKNKDNSAFVCGTNVVMRRSALEGVGGLMEKNITEDFITSMFIHKKGWKSHYISEVLAEGLAPVDLMSYYKQQFRWARGSLELLFKYNPIFKKGLTLAQKVQYISSSLYYFNGAIVLIDMIMPLLFLYFDLEVVTTTTTSFAVFFIPFMFMTMYLLYKSTDNSISFRALSFSFSSWYLQITATLSILLQEEVSFTVTPKQAQSGNYLFLAYPHLAYIALSVGGYIIAYLREGLSPAVATNIAWTLFNMFLFMPFIAASYSNNSERKS